MRRFHIYRCDLERDAPPRMQAYDFEAGDGDRMLLDALIRIKAIDPSLSFRRSCREGACGSGAMNINGKIGLPCVTNLRVAVRGGAQQYHSIKPWLVNDDPRPRCTASGWGWRSRCGP